MLDRHTTEKMETSLLLLQLLILCAFHVFVCGPVFLLLVCIKDLNASADAICGVTAVTTKRLHHTFPIHSYVNRKFNNLNCIYVMFCFSAETIAHCASL